MNVNSVMPQMQMLKINFAKNRMTNPIAFRGNSEDSFQKTIKPELAFLQDTTLSDREKFALIKELEGYVKVEDIATGGTHKKTFFDVEEHHIIDKSGKKGRAINLVNATSGINQINYERLQSSKESLISARDLKEKFISNNRENGESDYQRYIKDGVFEKVTLIDKKNG